jgi:hypothetical protein
MAEDDGYGLGITASAEAAAHYRCGAELMFLGQPGADEALRAALTADPTLALAHAALGRIHQMNGDRPASLAAVAMAREAAAGASERERSHVEVVAQGVEGKAPKSLALALEHLEAWPRDAVILSLPLGPFGLYAFSGMADHVPARLALCERYRSLHEGDWWFQTMYGFVLVESGEPAAGRALIERAFAARPDNANGAHDLAHALYETGSAGEADALIEGWLPGYDRRGILHGHLAWHQALAALDQDDPVRALAIYSTYVRPSATAALDINIVTDSASFLWRLGLYGHGAPAELWREAADFAYGAYPNPGFAFADVHLAMAAAAAGDDAVLQARLETLTAKVEAGVYRAGSIGPTATRALAAFADERFAECVDLLEPMAHEVTRIGGSNAQREVIEETLLVALMRAGETGRARTLLEARVSRRSTGRDRRWLAMLDELP